MGTMGRHKQWAPDARWRGVVATSLAVSLAAALATLTGSTVVDGVVGSVDGVVGGVIMTSLAMPDTLLLKVLTFESFFCWGY